MKCILYELMILEQRAPVSRQMCFVLDLVNDAALIQEYCRMHEPGSVWPGVIDHIRAQGVETMEIWQHTERLFMIIKAADDYPRRGASDAARQDSARWEAYMATFHPDLPDAAAGEKWLPMRRIFALADHIELSRS